jgi:hypothetical protein
MTKIAGSGSISQRHGSADPDPDPPQNVMDPQHCLEQIPTLEMVWVRSERRGISRRPSPPSLRGVFIHARWVKWESTLQATT